MHIVEYVAWLTTDYINITNGRFQDNDLFPRLVKLGLKWCYSDLFYYNFSLFICTEE